MAVFIFCTNTKNSPIFLHQEMNFQSIETSSRTQHKMQTTGKVLQVLQRNACCENVRKTSSQIYPEACVDPETFRSASLEVIKKVKTQKISLIF